MAWFRKSKYTTLKPGEHRSRIPQGLLIKCPACLEPIVRKEYEDGAKVCPKCGHHERLSAHDRINQLLDPDSFDERDGELTSADPLNFQDSKPYPARLADAREKTGLNEAVVCGIGSINGRKISIAVMDVSFIGGSMGSVVGEKIARAIERGIQNQIPVLIICGSGGARMQEGVLSLMQMAKTCAVAAKLHEARLPLITLLTDPTTGGVTASFAMIGDVILAEPNALVGFAGPRVIEATIKQILPPGFQRSNFVAEHGFIDIVCRRVELRATISNLIKFFMFARENHSAGSAPFARPVHEEALSGH
jgi:acetyl-CoA carboxylase carboxyl transferase subunit beta